MLPKYQADIHALCKLVLAFSIGFAFAQEEASALRLFGLCGVWHAEVLEEAPVFHLREKRGAFTTVFWKLAFCVVVKLYRKSQTSLNVVSVLRGIFGDGRKTEDPFQILEG